MTLDMQRNWANRPLGMRDVFPQQASRRRQLENQLLWFFEQHDFAMVSSGAFEYLDTLLRGRSVQQAEDWVQLFDSSGKAVALRPDMTPSIARMAAPLLASGHQEVRWCYVERVYRRTNDPASLSWVSGKAAESTQLGVEWIGIHDGQTDCDLIEVCQQALASLQLPNWQMVVSHAGFAPAFLAAYGTPKEGIDVLLRMLSQGDYVGFRQECTRFEVPTRLLDELAGLNPYHPESFDRTSDTIRALFGDKAHPDASQAGFGRGGSDGAAHPGNPVANWHSSAGFEVERAWTSLVNLAAELKNRHLDEHLSFDLTLYRDLAYYTGIVFEVFTTGVGAPIVLGGRYDDLLAQFGSPAPAIGFTFEIERLLAVLTDGNWVHGSGNDVSSVGFAQGSVKQGSVAQGSRQAQLAGSDESAQPIFNPESKEGAE